MKKIRTLLILLICIALPYSAMATMLSGMQCHHDGLGGIAAASSHHHEHGDHAMQEHHHDADQAKASDDHGCDCKVKCSCEHHCATGCSVAFTAATGASRSFMTAGAQHGPTAYLSHVNSVHGPSLFRPPIAAQTSAA